MVDADEAEMAAGAFADGEEGGSEGSAAVGAAAGEADEVALGNGNGIGGGRRAGSAGTAKPTTTTMTTTTTTMAMSTAKRRGTTQPLATQQMLMVPNHLPGVPPTLGNASTTPSSSQGNQNQTLVSLSSTPPGRSVTALSGTSGNGDVLSTGGGDADDFAVGVDLSHGGVDTLSALPTIPSSASRGGSRSNRLSAMAAASASANANAVNAMSPTATATLMSSSPSSFTTPLSPETDLRAIRLKAKRGRVTLKDTAESISRSIAKIAAQGDKRSPPVAANTPVVFPPEQSFLQVFEAERVPSVDISWYVWRLVNDLNASKEPILFRDDGSSVDLPDLAARATLASASASASTGSIGAGGGGGGGVGVGIGSADATNSDDAAMGRGLRCLLLGLVYIDRMSQNCSAFRLTSRNVHRVVLGAMYAALKFSDDAPGSLSYFSLLGGVSMPELKRIEAAVCRAVNFTFYVTEAEFRSHALAHLSLAVSAAAARKRRERRRLMSDLALAGGGEGEGEAQAGVGEGVTSSVSEPRLGSGVRTGSGSLDPALGPGAVRRPPANVRSVSVESEGGSPRYGLGGSTPSMSDAFFGRKRLPMPVAHGAPPSASSSSTRLGAAAPPRLPPTATMYPSSS